MAKDNNQDNLSASLADELSAPKIFPTVNKPASWELTLETGTIKFSPEWRKILLLPDDHPIEPLAATWWARIHPEDAESLRESARAIRSEKTETVEEAFRICRYDGSWIWLMLQGWVSERQNGVAAKVAGFVFNISRLRVNPRFQVNAASNTASAYKAMLDNSPDLMIRFDRELFPLYANPLLGSYLALPTTLGGETVESAGLDDGHMDFMQGNVQAVFDTGKVVRATTTFRTTRKGEVTGEYSFWPEFNEEGAVVSVISQFRDLSALVRSEQYARLNEMRLEALHDLTAMEDASEDAVRRFVVESITRLTGSAKGYIFIPDGEGSETGRMEWSLSHYIRFDKSDLPTDRVPGDCRARQNQPLSQAELVIMNGDGQKPVHLAFAGKFKVMRCIHAPIREEGRLVCLAAVCNKAVDYDEMDMYQLELFLKGAMLMLRRREFVQALQKAKAAAEHANQSKDEFLANISHELRTPLNGMLSMLQLLETSELSGAQLEYVRTAGQSGAALMRILSDILDFSRIESGKMELRHAPFDIRATFRSTLSLFQVEAEKRGIPLSADLADNLPPLLMGDEARVRQILFNLVGNAMKFTEKGEIRVECGKLPASRNGDSWIYFSVRDTGIGIAPAMHSAIFNPFTQLDNSRTRKYPGTGLGLGIVKRLSGLMGGGITVDSAEAEGTTIHCSLPLSTPGPEQARPVLRPEAVPPTGASLDVLVAEDDRISRFAMLSFLEKTGHRAVCVSNGREAVEALLLHPFHCFLTDIQMPEMDGLELIRRIRSGDTQDITPSEEIKKLVRAIFPDCRLRAGIPRNLVVAAVSAHAMSGDRELFLRNGMDLYLSKPVIMRELRNTLDQAAALMADRAGAPGWT